MKKQVLAGLAERLSAQGFDAENLMVCFKDVARAPAGGRVPHA